MNNPKITLRLLNEPNLFPNQSLLKENSNISINHGNDLLIDLNSSLLTTRSKKSNNNIKNTNISSNSNNNIFRNLDLKLSITKIINNSSIKPENLILFIYIDDKYKVLHDKNIFPYFNYTQCETTLINNSNNTSALNSEMRSVENKNVKKNQSFNSIINIQNNNNNNIIIYYKLCNVLQKLVVDIYQYETEKMCFNLPLSCSIYMLKIFIFQNLHLNINDLGKNFNIHGTGYTDIKGNIFKALTNRKFDENILIFEICKYYKVDENKIINLIMIEKSPNQCNIGLDFRFNYLRNFYVSDNLENDTRNYRCIINGFNLYIYCHNSCCKIYKSYFIVNKAYGVFDIFPCLSEIKCPFCGLDKIKLKNIGMVNAKWVYRGFLKQSKISKISGDGLTIINNKLYKIDDINFEEQFHSLLFEVEFYQSKLQKKSKYNTFNNRKDNSRKNLSNSINEEDNIDNMDFNDINLEQKYLTKGINTNNIQREFTFQKKNSNNNPTINLKNANNNKDKEILSLFHNNNNEKNDNDIDNDNDNDNVNKNDNIINPNLNLRKDPDINIKIDNQKEQCCADCTNITADNTCFIW